MGGQRGAATHRLIDGGPGLALGLRRRGDPLAPLERSVMTEKFQKAATEAGFKPFACPAATTSAACKNPLGEQMDTCTFCSCCEWTATSKD
jgi:gluconate 2-dehydrogenase alpha chain